MARMQGSGVRGAARLDEPEDDWLGDVADYDWSENAAGIGRASCRERVSPYV